MRGTAYRMRVFRFWRQTYRSCFLRRFIALFDVFVFLAGSWRAWSVFLSKSMRIFWKLIFYGAHYLFRAFYCNNCAIGVLCFPHQLRTKHECNQHIEERRCHCACQYIKFFLHPNWILLFCGWLFLIICRWLLMCFAKNIMEFLE